LVAHILLVQQANEGGKKQKLHMTTTEEVQKLSFNQQANEGSKKKTQKLHMVTTEEVQ